VIITTEANVTDSEINIEKV